MYKTDTVPVQRCSTILQGNAVKNENERFSLTFDSLFTVSQDDLRTYVGSRYITLRRQEVILFVYWRIARSGIGDSDDVRTG